MLERMKAFYYTRINREMVKVTNLLIIEYDVQAWKSKRLRNTSFPTQKCFSFIIQANGRINGKLEGFSI